MALLECFKEKQGIIRGSLGSISALNPKYPTDFESAFFIEPILNVRKKIERFEWFFNGLKSLIGFFYILRPKPGPNNLLQQI